MHVQDQNQPTSAHHSTHIQKQNITIYSTLKVVLNYCTTYSH